MNRKKAKTPIRCRLTTVNWEGLGRLLIAAAEAASRLIDALTRH